MEGLWRPQRGFLTFDFRGTKWIDKLFEGCRAFYGGLIEVPNG